MSERLVAGLTPALRTQLTAAYRALRAGSSTPFRGPSGGFEWGVPKGVVRAYVLARYGGEDPRAAMARAHFGTTELGAGGHEAVAAWAHRLQTLEGRR